MDTQRRTGKNMTDFIGTLPQRWFDHFPAKINDNIFQNKEKTLFWVHFCPKRIFPQNSGYVKLEGSPSI